MTVPFVSILYEMPASPQTSLLWITDTDDILHYINWETPKLVLFETDAEFNSGAYAEDSHWHRKVREIYSDFVDIDVEKRLRNTQIRF